MASMQQRRRRKSREKSAEAVDTGAPAQPQLVIGEADRRLDALLEEERLRQGLHLFQRNRWGFEG